MKRQYDYVSTADVTACKELAKTLIKRYLAKGYPLTTDDAEDIEYRVTKFFDCMYNDFRIDFQEWILDTIRKMYNR
jgi:hypothetical protein